MKGISGLVIAITLGIAAAAFNFFYLHMRSGTMDSVEFMGIQSGVVIPAGNPIEEEDIETVSIPRAWVGNLDKYALRRNEDISRSRPWRTLEGPALLLRDDIKTPPETLDLAEDEAAIGIPVDARSYPISLVIPGDKVSFVVPKWRVRGPTRAATAVPAEQGALEPEGAGPSQTPGPTETIGPFTVLSLGNRLGSAEVMKANRVPQFQGNVMTIRVKVGPDFKLVDPKAQKLLNLLHATGFRQVSIIHFSHNRGK